MEAAGAYKSFGEPFTRSYPSAANREATSEFLQTIHQQLCEGIAQGRGLSVDAVNALCSEGPWTAPDAKERGLIDDVAYFDQVEEALKQELGKGAKVSKFSAWAWRDGVLEWLESFGDTGDGIAVLYLQGSIVDEPSSRGISICPGDAVPALKQLRDDDAIAAVVLHVNSPGGSAPCIGSDLARGQTLERGEARGCLVRECVCIRRLSTYRRLRQQSWRVPARLLVPLASLAVNLWSMDCSGRWG